MKYFRRAPPHLQLNYTNSNLTFTKKLSLLWNIAFQFLETQNDLGFLSPWVWTVDSVYQVTSDGRSWDFVSRSPRKKNRRCRDIRMLAEKERSWREIQRRGEIGAKCGHPTPLYETHRLDFIVIVGPFTSSSFSLLSNSSPLFLFGVDFHFVLVNKWQRWEKEGQIGALKLLAVIILLIVGALVTTTLAWRVTIANRGGGDCQYSCKAIALAI